MPRKTMTNSHLRKLKTKMNKKPIDVEFKTTNYPEDDYLKIVKMLCFDMFQNKFVRSCLITIIHVNLLITFAQACLFLQKFDLEYFTKYAPMFFALQFGTVSCIGVLSAGTLTIDCLNLLEIWTFKNENHKILKDVKKEATILTTGVILNVLLGIFSGFIFMMPSDDDEDIFFIYSLIEDFTLPAWKTKLSIFFGIFCAFLCYVGISTLWQFVYGAFHAKVQVTIMLHYAQNINLLYSHRTLNDNECNEEVKKILKIFIQRHNKLTTFGNVVIKKIWFLILFYTVTGGLFLISVIFFLFTFEGGFTTTFVRTLPISISGGIVGLTVVTFGQSLEDISLMAFNEICSLSWYKWNKENQKMYVILLSNLIRPFKIKFTEKISVDHRLGLRIVKSVYSIVSILRRMKTFKY